MHRAYPPKFYISIFSNFSWVLVYSHHKLRENEDNGYAKFWSVNKVPYGLCENSEWLFYIDTLITFQAFQQRELIE